MSKNTFFKNTSGRLLLLLAFQKQPPEAFYEKGVLENFAKFGGKHLWFANFSRTPFFTEPLWTTTSGSSLQLYQNGALPTIFGKPQVNTLYLETLTLGKFQVNHFFLGSTNFQCIFSLVYTVYCQQQPPE